MFRLDKTDLFCHFRDMITLSNMVKTGNVFIDDEYVMDMYAQSVTMSTYLLAFIVSELTNFHVKGKKKNGNELSKIEYELNNLQH